MIPLNYINSHVLWPVMSEDVIKRMLENLSESKSTPEPEDRHSRYKISEKVDYVVAGGHCPEVAVVNISQDHWVACKEGPVNKDNEFHTWTAISGSRPPFLYNGTVLIVRRTSTVNKSKNLCSESKTNGVMGIWTFDKFEPVDSNENHRWNSIYEWYLHCTSIETRPEVVYKEKWGVLDVEPNTMQGQGVFRLTKQQQKNYLGELLLNAKLSQTTKQFLGSLVECVNEASTELR